MLPQKKNPDIAELARGKAGRLIGDLTGFLATLKGLPLAYNRDLQEDKEPLFDALDQCRLALRGAGRAARDRRVRRRRACRPRPTASDAAAVDLAEQLVQRGMPFREAHALVGRAGARSRSSAACRSTSWCSTDPDLGPEALALLEPGAAVPRRTTPGGAGPGPVAVQLGDGASAARRRRRAGCAARVRRVHALPRSFYDRDSLALAPELLNKVLVAARPTAVAWRRASSRSRRTAATDDPGSHAFRGTTPRNATMFGPPGHLYVYFTYGMHWCANVVADRATATRRAVLLRAAAPLDGLEVMRERRVEGAGATATSCAGPGAPRPGVRHRPATHDGNDLVRGAAPHPRRRRRAARRARRVDRASASRPAAATSTRGAISWRVSR